MHKFCRLAFIMLLVIKLFEAKDVCNITYVPNGPCVKCSFLPLEFLDCKKPVDLKGNKTAFEELGYGCLKMGGQKYEDIEFTKVECAVLPGIDCHGEKTFLRDGFPCIKYTGHSFISTLLYSILLGFLGIDRFCLGHTGTAVGKLLTLGGVGIWWIVDIVLLVSVSQTRNFPAKWNNYK
nr:EOG090X0IT6 [Eulimnadia texana]